MPVGLLVWIVALLVAAAIYMGGLRGVLYTAITRARELLVIVGDDSAVNKMAENDRRSRRYSGLKWRLRKGGEEK